MTTELIITGVGCPIPSATSAGPGVLVRYRPPAGDESIHLQFDAGRSTVMRLMGADCRPSDLDAVFLTHHHSDHCTGLQDLVLTRWVMDRRGDSPALPIICPEGSAVSFAERMLDAWDNDLAVRKEHTGRTDDPALAITGFPLPPYPGEPVEVYRRGDVVVRAGQVRHEPVYPAVGYRIDTPDGTMAITGDTLVCDEVATLAAGVDVLVYEALRFSEFDELPPWRTFILDYHADTALIGKQALELDTPHLVLTHLIPPPADEADEARFVDDIRASGFEGELTVARDLTTIVLG
ncbi:MAG: MBL fold metallo-hydrolase [Acidimicrobiia bacterium]|nr:MBL fold metallo-hydrolase [Acidimicrobiia bacterium]